MAEMNMQENMKASGTGLEKNLERLSEDLDIMERYAKELDDVEDVIQESMRRWDREYKDAHFHSVPSPKKHMR